MRFRHYDALRTFTLVASRGSVTRTASELGLTKGAVSHQLCTLEDQLGFKLFERLPRGMALTRKGEAMFDTARAAFGSIDRQIGNLRAGVGSAVTLGLSTYLASRWLSPKLMGFLQAYPAIRLRIQPMIDLYDLERDGIDIAIRWGKGDWSDLPSELLFNCPAFPAAAPGLVPQKSADDLYGRLACLTLLHDRDGSSAWEDWFAAAKIAFDSRATTLTVRDPNVRVQAVIDGQGIALFDRLVNNEITAGKLQRITSHELNDYGYYLAYPPGRLSNPDVANLARWLKHVAAEP